MSVEDSSGCRIFGILAREASVAVLFRRGPSRWVEVIKWCTSNDTFERGHWFHGRLYERRCDLTPNGKLLVYFVNKFEARTLKDREYTCSWTAVSKPPWLTALALWPKGDCWHGGGLFESNRSLWLNHRPEWAKAHPRHTPQGIAVAPNPGAYGEDYPIYQRRLLRDGWQKEQEGEFLGVPFKEGGGWRTVKPEIWSRLSPDGRLRLRMTLAEINFKSYAGPYVLEFSVVQTSSGHEIEVGRATWADWDHKDRLVYAQGGILFTATVDSTGALSRTELMDFNGDKPQAIESPKWAQKWRR